MSALRPFRPAHVPGPPRMVPRRAVPGDPPAVGVASDPVLAAESEAAAILVAAEAERDRMVAEGFAQGAARAEAELAPERAAIAQSLAALAEARAGLVESICESAAHLAVEIAMDLVGDAVATSPDAIVPIVNHALAAAPVGVQRIRIHPTMAAAISADLDLDVAPDPSLAPGDVVVETTAGEVDHRLAVARDLLHDAVRGARASMP